MAEDTFSGIGMRQDLRREMKAVRSRLSVAEKMSAAEAVAQHVLAHLPNTGGYLAGYWATGGELPLHILQMRLPTDWIWCLPIVQPDRQLLFAPWRTGDELATNRYGIPEPDLEPNSCLAPEAMAQVLLPLLAYTRKGQRLGMGGGYYDASFAFRQQYSSPPLLIGIGYACQEIAALDSQDWDVRLDVLANENEWLEFAKGND